MNNTLHLEFQHLHNMHPGLIHARFNYDLASEKVSDIVLTTKGPVPLFKPELVLHENEWKFWDGEHYYNGQLAKDLIGNIFSTIKRFS